MWKHTLAATALIAISGVSGEAQATRLDNVEAWYQHARSTIGPLASTEELIDRREVIAPPIGIDPGINLTPLNDHSRLRVIRPPGIPEDGLHPK